MPATVQWEERLFLLYCIDCVHCGGGRLPDAVARHLGTTTVMQTTLRCIYTPAV